MKLKLDLLYQQLHMPSLCVCGCVWKLAGRITSKAFNLLWLFCVGPQGDSSRVPHSHCPLTDRISPHTHTHTHTHTLTVLILVEPLFQQCLFTISSNINVILICNNISRFYSFC